MLPMDHFVSRILYFTTAGVKCCVAAVKSCSIVRFGVRDQTLAFTVELHNLPKGNKSAGLV
jgi:hypothetical protein